MSGNNTLTINHRPNEGPSGVFVKNEIKYILGNLELSLTDSAFQVKTKGFQDGLKYTNPLRYSLYDTADGYLAKGLCVLTHQIHSLENQLEKFEEENKILKNENKILGDHLIDHQEQIDFLHKIVNKIYSSTP